MVNHTDRGRLVMRGSHRFVGVCMVGSLALLAGQFGNSNAHAADLRVERQRKLRIGETTRTYHLQRSLSKVKRPLVLVFHGGSGSANQTLGFEKSAAPLAVWREIGKRDGLVVAAPDGLRGSNGNQGWNDCRGDATNSPTSDDVAFTLALIDELVKTASVDPNRVYAVGMSNGAMFSLRLAIEQGERFAGFGVISGAMPAQTECVDNANPKPIVFISGTSDPLVPFGGGPVVDTSSGRGTVLSNADTITLAVARNGGFGTTKPPTTRFADRDRRDGSTVSLQSFRGSAASVHTVTVTGGGHVEPSTTQRVGRAYERFVGKQNHDIEAAELIWQLWNQK
jgi:polyhydroxybutyrate depolymerase